MCAIVNRYTGFIGQVFACIVDVHAIRLTLTGKMCVMGVSGQRKPPADLRYPLDLGYCLAIISGLYISRVSGIVSYLHPEPDMIYFTKYCVLYRIFSDILCNIFLYISRGKKYDTIPDTQKNIYHVTREM